MQIAGGAGLHPARRPVECQALRPATASRDSRGQSVLGLGDFRGGDDGQQEELGLLRRGIAHPRRRRTRQIGPQRMR